MSAEPISLCQFAVADPLDCLVGTCGLGGSFTSQLVEHPEPSRADELIRHSAAVPPGGRVLVVTPNLTDSQTLREIFWPDTTPVRPYPPRLIASLVEMARAQLGGEDWSTALWQGPKV